MTNPYKVPRPHCEKCGRKIASPVYDTRGRAFCTNIHKWEYQATEADKLRARLERKA